MPLYKPKPKPEEKLPEKVTLPVESAVRSFKGIKELLNEADNRRGVTVELPWTQDDKPGHRFMLTVMWQKLKFDPIWSFSEESDGNTTVHFSQPFNPSDIELMYDMIAMTVGGPTKDGGAKIPETLKPSPADLLKPGDLYGPDDSSAPAKTNTAQPATPAAPQPAHTAPAQSAPMPPNYPGQPGYAYPNAPYPPQPYPPQGMPVPMPMAMPYPMPVPPVYPTAMPGYGVPNQSWQYAMPSTTLTGLQPMIDPSANLHRSLPKEMDLDTKNKKPNIDLGGLLIDANLITEPALDAALKLQELVKKGRLSPEKAPLLLQMLFSVGAAIEDYIDPGELLSPIKSDKEKTEAALRLLNDHRLALELLVKSGLLTEVDLKTVNNVFTKHGGELRSILQAAGKLDAKVFDAAVTCVELERNSAMKMEQSIILLNYASRSRLSFDEAIEELGWPKPEKPQKYT